MRVLVIGANGQIGKLLVDRLQQSGHTPIAMIRSSEQIEQFSTQKIQTVLGDLEQSITQLAAQIVEVQAEAIVFSAGSGGHTGADKTLLIDLDGAIKMIEATERSGVKRFVMVSAIGVHKWHDDEVPQEVKKGSYYSAAKYYADCWLELSKLDYTILRPGRLTNHTGTGKIQVGRDVPFESIAREDVAEVIVSILDKKNTFGKAFDVINGEQLISEAIHSI